MGQNRAYYRVLQLWGRTGHTIGCFSYGTEQGLQKKFESKKFIRGPFIREAFYKEAFYKEAFYKEAFCMGGLF